MPSTPLIDHEERLNMLLEYQRRLADAIIDAARRWPIGRGQAERVFDLSRTLMDITTMVEEERT